MVTLIGFLLFTTSFLGIVSIESPLPQASPQEVQQKIQNKQKPLQLTVSFREKDVEIWSAFSKIVPKAILNASDGQPNAKGIHEAILEIKKQFPQENSVVLVPHKDSPYDSIVSVMDALRTLEDSDPPIYQKNTTTGIDEPLKELFPKVIFGNLLGAN
jgi:biopolymer transport protein ExbD